MIVLLVHVYNRPGARALITRRGNELTLLQQVPGGRFEFVMSTLVAFFADSGLLWVSVKLYR